MGGVVVDGVADKEMSRFYVASKPVARKSDIARGFGKACDTYESASRLQRLTGNAMLERLACQPGSGRPLRILDLGCGTGWFTRILQQHFPESQVTGADLSPGMIAHAGLQSHPKIRWLVADAGHLPLPDARFDLVFSNLMIQWCDDPKEVLNECRRLLKPNGRLMISTLVDGTLRELRQAWAKADPGRVHVNHFERFDALSALVKAELPEAVSEARTIGLPYHSPVALAHELKFIGAGFKGRERRRSVTAPGRLRAMCKHYPVGPKGEVLASYEAAWFYWQKHI